jgi:hypothetical protein
LKPGAAVFVIALKKPDGTVTAARLYAEKDGIKPPMWRIHTHLRQTYDGETGEPGLRDG